MIRWPLALVVAVGITTPVTADPLRRTNLPDDIETCLHVDMDVVGQVDWLRHTWQSLLAQPSIRERLEELPDETRFLTNSQLHDVTLYTVAGGDFVFRVHIDTDMQQLVNIISEQTDHRLVSHDDHTVHGFRVDQEAWCDKLPFVGKSDRQHGTTQLHLAILQEDLIVLSSSLHALTHALDVMDERTPCLDEEAFAELCSRCPERTLVRYQTLAKPEKHRTDAGEMRIADCVAHVEDRLHLRATVEMPSSEVAASLMQYVEPDNLMRVIESIAPRSDTTEDEPRVDETVRKQVSGDGSSHKNSLTLGVSLNGSGFDEVDNAVRCILQSLNISQDGRILHLHWNSYADVEYAYREHDGCHDHKFMVHVMSDKPERVASRPQTSSTR